MKRQNGDQIIMKTNTYIPKESLTINKILSYVPSHIPQLRMCQKMY